VGKRQLCYFQSGNRSGATGEHSGKTGAAFSRFRGLSVTKTLDKARPALAAKSKGSWLVATFFGIGHLRPGPGTYASATTVLLWWAAARVIDSRWQLFVAVALALAVTALGIRPSTVVARESGVKDPGFVVIDEVAGQLIALIGVPLDWKYLLAGFILFRGFDITKPFPLRRLESLPEGTGIMMDDVGAGLYALLLLQVWIHLLAR
jgi:phosphatidylglycerophosphatase A